MITRPLDLLSKLRPPPRNYDSLFLVNGALIALFFALFGSRFVLSPGLRVDGKDIQLPRGPSSDLALTPVSISVTASGQMVGDTGQVEPARLKEWMAAQVKRAPGSTLLVILDTHASADVLTEISVEAVAAGFSGIQIATQQAPKTTEVTFPK